VAERLTAEGEMVEHLTTEGEKVNVANPDVSIGVAGGQQTSVWTVS